MDLEETGFSKCSKRIPKEGVLVMKILAGTALALAVSVTSICPAFTEPALSQSNNMMAREQMTGQIESIDGSTVMVRSSDGTVRMYQIDPAVLTSLKLSQGSTISLSRNLMSGEIIRMGPRNVLVRLDNGETKYFIVTREERGTLAPGERVVITPDQKIDRAESYVLTARDVVLVQPIASTMTDTTATVSSTSTEVETSTMTAETTAPVSPMSTPVEPMSTMEEAQPVRALW